MPELKLSSPSQHWSAEDTEVRAHSCSPAHSSAIELRQKQPQRELKMQEAGSRDPISPSAPPITPNLNRLHKKQLDAVQHASLKSRRGKEDFQNIFY